jgi:hypothetical protein
MTQYEGGYSGTRMSNRAVAAYDRGRLPLSKITAGALRDNGIPLKLGEFKALVADYEIIGDEWHHTGSYFAETEFFDLAAIAESYEESPELLVRHRAEAARLVAEAKAKKNAATAHEDCTVEWLEWYGTRKHPWCEEHSASGCRVEVKGQTAQVYNAEGRHFLTKRTYTNGFHFESAAMRKDRLRQEKERDKQIAAARRAERAWWRDLERRFKAVATGRKVEATAYFAWRDDHDRDSTAVTWKPVSHKDVIGRLRESGRQYAERTVERLEAGEREVVRVGLHIGIRWRGAAAVQTGVAA